MFCILHTHLDIVQRMWIHTNLANYTHSHTHCHTHRTWRNAQFGEKIIIQMEEKSRETATELKQAIGQPNNSLTNTDQH